MLKLYSSFREQHFADNFKIFIYFKIIFTVYILRLRFNLVNAFDKNQFFTPPPPLTKYFGRNRPLTKKKKMFDFEHKMLITSTL